MATIEKRGKSYRITASCGYDVDGTQERPRITWRPEPGMTEKQIEKELNRRAVLFEEDCKNGFAEENIKFQLFAENRYFVDYAPENLKRKTIDTYQHYEDRVYGALGHLRMDRITPSHIQKFVRGLLKGDKDHKPLSKKSAKNYLTFVSSVFEYAIRLKAAKSNPCRAVRISLKGRPEHDFYTLDEAQHFLDLLLQPAEPLMYQRFLSWRSTEVFGAASCWGWNGRTLTLTRASSAFEGNRFIRKRPESIPTSPKPKVLSEA